MRIVHISDTAFVSVPEGACLHVSQCDGYKLLLSLCGLPAQTVLFTSVNEQGIWFPQMKAHLDAEVERFKDWLMNASQGAEFEFQRVLDMGAPVADVPFRIREAGGSA